MSRKGLSFHPHLGASLDLLFGLAFWWWFGRINFFWMLVGWFGARLLLWLILVRFVSYLSGVKRWQHFCSLALFWSGATSLLLFVEWDLVRHLLGAAIVLVPAFSFWLIPSSVGQPTFIFKPQRRWRLLMSTFGLLGLWSGGYALIVLRIINFNTPLFLILATLFSVLVALWWLWEYGCIFGRHFWLWALALVLVIGELSVILYLWPVGYFVSGFLLAWLWYVIWMMARFHLSETGINWKKQIYFFAGNGLMIILFLLLIARWR